MDVEVQIIKDIPVKQIDQFEDRVMYNTALLTREFTKGRMAYPYRTGKLMQTEVAAPIIGNNKEYGLGTGVDYAKTVWNYKNANWTNPNTEPQWYYSVFRRNGVTIINNAVHNAIKEL